MFWAGFIVGMAGMIVIETAMVLTAIVFHKK
jgi:hypothetical protein